MADVGWGWTVEIHCIKSITYLKAKFSMRIYPALPEKYSLHRHFDLNYEDIVRSQFDSLTFLTLVWQLVLPEYGHKKNRANILKIMYWIVWLQCFCSSSLKTTMSQEFCTHFNMSVNKIHFQNLSSTTCLGCHLKEGKLYQCAVKIKVNNVFRNSKHDHYVIQEWHVDELPDLFRHVMCTSWGTNQM